LKRDNETEVSELCSSGLTGIEPSKAGDSAEYMSGLTGEIPVYIKNIRPVRFILS
jgi:hypothetical protein